MFDRLRAIILPTWTLAEREWVRFLRTRSRIVGAFATPLLFWFLLGSGLGGSFRPAFVSIEIGYLEYFFPGTMALILLFTSIFSTISIIEDRREGFLQSVLVAPIPRASIVFGKVLGGAIPAVLQGALFMLLAPLVGFSLGFTGGFLALLSSFILSYTLTALGFLFAWRLNSVQGFHAIMNLLLIPMWLLSGAVFPLQGAPGWLVALMWINPLTYGIAALREALYWGQKVSVGPPFPVCIIVVLGFGLIFHFLSSREVHQAKG